MLSMSGLLVTHQVLQYYKIQISVAQTSSIGGTGDVAACLVLQAQLQQICQSLYATVQRLMSHHQLSDLCIQLLLLFTQHMQSSPKNTVQLAKVTVPGSLKRYWRIASASFLPGRFCGKSANAASHSRLSEQLTQC